MNTANPAAEERKSFAPDWKQSGRLCLTLLIITAAAALILALVNALTADTIAARKAEQRMAAMSSVMPRAGVFSEMYSEDETIEGISGAYIGTTLVGYCVEVSVNGFSGPIDMMVGVNTGGSVTGVVLLDHTESPGLGANAEKPEFLNQYLGKSGTVTVNSGSNAINAVTGATITTRAVTDGVNTALTAVFNYHAEGGPVLNEGDV